MVLGALFMLAPMLYPLVTGRIFTRDDLVALHLPFRHLYSASLGAGEFLLWTPAYHAGFFLHGAGEAGMAPPLHLLLYGLLPLGVAFNLEIICSYLFLMGGAYLLLRTLHLSIEGALVGAMLTAFSGFTLYNLMHVNHIATLAHAPWLLLACRGLLTGRIRPAAAFALAAVVTGSQLLTGNPQYVWITLVVVAYMCACEWRRATRPAHFAALAIAAGLGGLIGAVQILPSVEFFRDSARAAWTPELAVSFSMSPWNLVQLWSPFAFEFRVHAPGEEFMIHEFVVYNGAFCSLALAWVAIRWRELRHRPLVIALLGLAALSLWLAVGRYGGLYPWLAQLPVLSGLRAPARHIVLFQFALAGIAGIAFDDLATMGARPRIEPRRLWPLAAVVAIALATPIAAASLAGSEWAGAHAMRLSPWLRSAPWSAAIIVLALLMIAAARGRSWAIPVIVAVTVADLAAWGYSYAYRWGPIQSVSELMAAAQIPEGAAAGDVIPPVAGGRDYLGVLRGLRLTNGYTGLYSQSRMDFGNPQTERLAGITWRGDGDRWHRVDDALPRARLASEARVSTNPQADIMTIDIRHTALVEQPLELKGPPGTAHVVLERPGLFEVETTAAGRQLLILTERFHHGWQVTVDDVPQPPVRVDGDFLGCIVEAGTHRVVLEFAPRSVTDGLRLTIAGLFLTVLAAITIERRGWLRSTAA